MSWLTLTIIAQFLNSTVALFDKYLVSSKKITTPILYVFYTGILSCLGILIYVFELFLPHIGLPSFSNITIISLEEFLLIACSAIVQFGALWGMFSALKKNDASDVVPVVGSFAAISALIIGFSFDSLLLPSNFVIGFILLIIGTLLISHLKFNIKTFSFTLLGGIGFALHNILLKKALGLSSFDSGFFWFCIISTSLSVLFLFSKTIHKSFRSQRKEKHAKTTGIILILNKIVAGIAGILLIKANQIGEVSLVQALGGLQFVFLFLLAAILGPVTPFDFGENISRKDLYHKLGAISIIFVGFVLLFT